MELNKIYQCDCIEGLNNIEDNSIDCIVTSPPYNKKFFSHQKQSNQIWGKFNIDYSSYSDDMPIGAYEEWMISVINLMLKKIKPDGSIFFNHKPIRHDNMIYHPLQFILRTDAKIYQEIVWDRRNSPNIRNDILVPCTERIYWLAKGKPRCYRDSIEADYRSEVWTIIAKRQTDHPAPFPVQLVENCIKLSTNEGDLVVDPFMGSGTTAVASQILGRKWIGFDIDGKYCDSAKERLKLL